MSKATHVYLARKSCGCTVAGVCDGGDQWTGDRVALFIRAGLTIERVPVEEARTRLHHCVHERQGRQLEMPS